MKITIIIYVTNHQVDDGANGAGMFYLLIVNEH